MPVIDEDGDLFGVVNAVDAAAVLVILAVAAGGLALVAGSGGSDDRPTVLTQTVTVETTGEDSPGIESLRPGLVDQRGVVSVTDVTRVGGGGDRWTVDARLVINTSDGLPTFRGERLYIGRNLTLRAGEVTVDGVVTGAFEPVEVSSVPTPTPRATPASTLTATATPTGTATPTATPGGTRTITVETEVDAAVAEDITPGPVPAADVVAVREVTRQTESGGTVTLALTLEVAATEADGEVFFRGVALERGSRVRLDLGAATVTGTVTAV